MITSATKLQTAPGHLFTELGEEVALLSIQTGRYFLLNAVGARVWDLLQEPRTPHEVVSVLLREFDVEHSECKNDVDRLLAGLFERGLIRTV